MGQASQGLAARRFCHTQEIAHEPIANEWQSLGHWTAEVEEKQGLGGECKAAVTSWGASCCATEDGGCAVEEVLVVHHDALKKVNFLLRVDELSGCELPSVPECVIAAKRAELQRKSLGLAKDPGSPRSDEWSPRLNEDGTDSEGARDDGTPRETRGRLTEDRAGATSHPRPGQTRGTGPALQPCSNELFNDDEEAMWPDDLDSTSNGPASSAAEPGPAAGPESQAARKPRLPARLPA